MAKRLHLMELKEKKRHISVPDGIMVLPYDPQRHHGWIRSVYAKAFSEPPWRADWDRFPEFDPHGVFVAESEGTAEVVGYVISFQRLNTGYVSVLAVVPACQRRGIGTALVRAAVTYLRSLAAVEIIQVHAFADSAPAVAFYMDYGFRVVRTYEDTDEEPNNSMNLTLGVSTKDRQLAAGSSEAK